MIGAFLLIGGVVGSSFIGVCLVKSHKLWCAQQNAPEPPSRSPRRRFWCRRRFARFRRIISHVTQLSSHSLISGYIVFTYTQQSHNQAYRRRKDRDTYIVDDVRRLLMALLSEIDVRIQLSRDYAVPYVRLRQLG